jgi:acyl-coenzyme A thioesterase PaaI-like protein
LTSIPDSAQLSAFEIARRLGDELDAGTAVGPEALALVRAARELVEAVVMTDIDPEARSEAAADLAAVTARLRERRRSGAVLLIRHPDGRIEHLSQAGSGRLNPQAPELVFDGLGPLPPTPTPVELVAHCTLTAAQGGPPGRVHGGQVAALLDEVVGVAAFAAGAPGMTVTLGVEYRRPTPHGTPLEIRARLDRWEGRKRWVSGEVLAGGEVTARAEAFLLGGQPS